MIKAVDGLGKPRSLAGLLDEDQGDATNRRHFLAGAAGVAGLAMIGDAAAAVTAASQIQAAQLPTAERRARYWCDVARAWDLYGNPQRTYAALTAAFREAPGEVRDRSSMRALVSRLLPHDRALSGLRTFAARLKVL